MIESEDIAGTVVFILSTPQRAEVFHFHMSIASRGWLCIIIIIA